MPRPRSLTDTEVANAALVVIDRDGFAAFTMRAVATQLDVATMSLYRYVRDREHLEELIVELLLSETDLTPPRRGSWRRRITTLIERVRTTLMAHPQVMPLTLAHRLTSPNGLRLSEAVFRVLADAGFNGEQRIVANRSLMVYLLGSIQLEQFGPLSEAGTTTMANLSLDEYPMLAQTAHKAQNTTAKQQFRWGLNITLDGLEALLTGPSRSRNV